MKPCGSLRSSARRSTERGIRKTTSLTRTPPDRVAQTSSPATSICHEIGVPSAEADDTTIDMKPQQEPSTQEVLAGLVERVTFHNDDNGFCVLRIKARGHRDLITVVGHAATISSGEWVTASGEWINDHLARLREDAALPAWAETLLEVIEANARAPVTARSDGEPLPFESDLTLTSKIRIAPALSCRSLLLLSFSSSNNDMPLLE